MNWPDQIQAFKRLIGGLDESLKKLGLTQMSLLYLES